MEPSGWIKRLIKRACQHTFSSSGRVKRPCVIATTDSATHTISSGPILCPPNSTIASTMSSLSVRIRVGTHTNSNSAIVMPPY